MRRSIPLALALGLASSPAAAETPSPAAPPAAVAPAIAAPSPAAPSPAAAATAKHASEIELTHIGLAVVAVGVFSAAIAGACGEDDSGSALVRCRWGAGSAAVGLGLASVPFFILGVRQDRAFQIVDKVKVAVGPRGVSLGLAASF
jgi:hypothetical protein